MKKSFPLAVLLFAAAALALRLWQVRTGFEADTGLPVAGDPAATALAALLVLAAAALALLSRKLPKEGAFPFSTDRPPLLALPVAGALAVGVSGGLDLLLAVALGDAGISAHGATVLVGSGIAVTAMASGTRLLLGILSLACAVCLLIAAVSCRRGREAERSGTLLLAAPICMVARLVLVYRVDSVDPSLQSYYVELLALVFLTLALYHLASFACGAGDIRRFALSAGCAVVLCAAALADGGGPSPLLLYGGGAAVVLGFLLLCLASEGQTGAAPGGAS